MKSLIGSSCGQEGRDYATGNHNFRLEPHLESTFDKNGVTTVKTLKVLLSVMVLILIEFIFVQYSTRENEVVLYRQDPEESSTSPNSTEGKILNSLDEISNRCYEYAYGLAESAI